MKITVNQNILLFAMFFSMQVFADPLMSPDWADKACKAFNSNPILTGELSKDWVNNHGGKGFKVVQLYRTDCGIKTKVEMRIVAKDGKAICEYGGKVKSSKLDFDVDYLMHSKTEYWKEMGAGQYGPMRAMFTGALKFDGPMFEAMSVMGPFEQFLLLPGKVPGDDKCPVNN